jgi:hypothetical protein
MWCVCVCVGRAWTPINWPLFRKVWGISRLAVEVFSGRELLYSVELFGYMTDYIVEA